MKTELGHLFRNDCFYYNGKKYRSLHLTNQYQFVKCVDLVTGEYINLHLDTIVEKEGEAE